VGLTREATLTSTTEGGIESPSAPLPFSLARLGRTDGQREARAWLEAAHGAPVKMDYMGLGHRVPHS